MRHSIVCLLILFFAAPVSADAAFQFTLPGLRAPDDSKVDGIRFSLFHGRNESLSGVDFGLLSLNESGMLSGAAFVLGLHRLTGDMDGGVAMSLVNFHSGNDSGLNAAFINKVNGADGAVDLGFVNIADGETMVDIGALNMSKASTVQLGFINMTKKIDAVQLGFINIADNGFVKVFPFFNFPKK